MSDNTPQNGTAIVAADEVSYSGDTAVVQIAQLGFVTGTEGSRTLAKAPGDSTNGYKVQEGDGANVTLGAKADAKSSATDTTAISAISILKQISYSIQSVASYLAGILRTQSADTTASATIAIGTHTTVQATATDMRGYRLQGLVVPSNFDGTTISFHVSADNSTFQALYDINNALVQMTVAVSRSYDTPGELASWPYVKIVCGAAQTTNDTVFTWVLRS